MTIMMIRFNSICKPDSIGSIWSERARGDHKLPAVDGYSTRFVGIFGGLSHSIEHKSHTGSCCF